MYTYKTSEKHKLIFNIKNYYSTHVHVCKNWNSCIFKFLLSEAINEWNFSQYFLNIPRFFLKTLEIRGFSFIDINHLLISRKKFSFSHLWKNGNFLCFSQFSSSCVFYSIFSSLTVCAVLCEASRKLHSVIRCEAERFDFKNFARGRTFYVLKKKLSRHNYYNKKVLKCEKN